MIKRIYGLIKNRVRIMFAWYDIWIGFYWDNENKRLFILPIPMLGIVIQFNSNKPIFPCCRTCGSQMITLPSKYAYCINCNSSEKYDLITNEYFHSTYKENRDSRLRFIGCENLINN